MLRVATETRHKLELVYLDLQRRATERTVCPHGYVFCGQVWTLAVWCDTREAFRSFGVVDRIRQVDLLPNRYSDELGGALADKLRHVQGAG